MVSIIVAMTDERVIGLNNTLPWHISEDLKRFKRLTMGHPIIMGRKTFDSIGRALPGRQNIVVTRNANLKLDGVTMAANYQQALAACGTDEKEIFVIGGASLFREALPNARKLYLTLIHKKYEGDTFFPPTSLEKEFRIIERREYGAQDEDHIPYSFIIAERTS